MKVKIGMRVRAKSNGIGYDAEDEGLIFGILDGNAILYDSATEREWSNDFFGQEVEVAWNGAWLDESGGLRFWRRPFDSEFGFQEDFIVAAFVRTCNLEPVHIP